MARRLEATTKLSMGCGDLNRFLKITRTDLGKGDSEGMGTFLFFHKYD